MRTTTVIRLPETFRALVTKGKKTLATVETLPISDLPKVSTIKQMPGNCDTMVKVDFSTINYKDAMVVTGNFPGIKYPMVGGIDMIGTVAQTSSSTLKVGETVILNSFGTGTDHFGGYSEISSVRSDWLLPLTDIGSELQTIDAARIGTAGLTAMLMVNALTEVGGLDGPVKPSDGPVVVTGATGGVGSVAVSILSALGYEVAAVTGKADKEVDYLKILGAANILSRSDFEGETKPLGREMYAGCIDTVGGSVLANVLTKIKHSGSVSACGMAGGMGLTGLTVAPFILRGVSLLGVDCVFQGMSVRQRVYKKYVPILLKNKILEVISSDQVISLREVPEIGEKMLGGKTKGRYVVKIDENLD